MDVTNSENLVDYFFVCGLDPNIGLDSYEISNEFDKTDLIHGLPPLKCPYKPSILQKFPDHCGSYAFPEDYSITSLCMPDGLKLFSSSSMGITNPINHNFIVIREDASRIYGTALLFVEEIDNDDIKLAVTDLQNMYRMGHHLAVSSGQVHSCNECQTKSSSGVANATSAENASLESGHESGNDVNSNGEFWQENEKLYTIKAIGLLSQHAYISCHESWLYDLWLFIVNQSKQAGLLDEEVESCSDVDIDPRDIKLELLNSKINLESYIYNILFEINSPKNGQILRIEGPNLRHYCLAPNPEDLPVFELPMRGLLEALGLDNLIKVYSCVLLEYRVVILSKDYRLLMLTADCITCLLFPFVWSHVYAPILPLAAHHFLKAPLPFIMGIKKGYEEEPVQLASEACVCYVNVDDHTVSTPEGIPSFPYEMELRKVITELLVDSVDQLPKNRVKKRGNNNGTSNWSSRKRPEDVGELGSAPLSHESNNKIRSSVTSLICNDRLAREAGVSVHDSLEPIIKCDQMSDKCEGMIQNYMATLKFNKYIRELFLSHFLHIFYDYDQFIILPKKGSTMESFFADRESTVQNFDKAGFLSEQPETHLPFLSAFLETQMFADFIDMKMLSIWEEPHPNLAIFERKLSMLKRNYNKEMTESGKSEIVGIRPYRGYVKSSSIIKAASSFEKIVKKALLTKTENRPHVLSCHDPSSKVLCSSDLKTVQAAKGYCTTHHYHHPNQLVKLDDSSIFGIQFPSLQGDCLRNKPKKKSVTTAFNKSNSAVASGQDLDHTKVSGVIMHPSSTIQRDSNSPKVPSKLLTLKPTKHIKNGGKEFNTLKESRVRKPYLPIMIPHVMPKNHWTFVNALLTETKAKTKRMVLEKMGGQEALELGHGDLIVSDIEENTLVAGLCDLLERIWCHGLNQNQGKSALWMHLIKYVERDQKTFIIKRTNKENMRRGSTGITPVDADAGGNSGNGGGGGGGSNNGSGGVNEKSQNKSEVLKNALIGVGIDSYRLFRFFNEYNGEISVSGNNEYFGSLKKLVSSGEKSNSVSGQNSNSGGNIRSSTPEFINKGFGVSNNPGGVSDIFFNWNQSLSIGSLGRKRGPRNSVGGGGGGNSGSGSSSGTVAVGSGSGGGGGVGGGIFSSVLPPAGSSTNGSGSRVTSSGIDLVQIFGPERRSLVTDVRAVQSITDIKTDVGLARAFVRLALEKKLLSEHLRRLLQDTDLLRKQYERIAFLRCEEEREQFLFHLMALQAVEYYSFTNLYVRSQLIYRVFICSGSGKRFSPSASTTANVWFCIYGQHGNSDIRNLPKGMHYIEFENKNMGILTTMRIGHDNSGISPKWYIEYVLVQNVFTDHIYRFLCNRWLGKSIGDGSTERLLVGELIRMSDDDARNSDFRSSKNSLAGLQTPPRSRSPSVGRKDSEGKIVSDVANIQEQLGNSVNNLFKYFCRIQDREKLSTANSYHHFSTVGSGSTGSMHTRALAGSCHVTLLLCGEYGLVASMERVFRHGFKSGGLFHKKFFVWDYLEKVSVELSNDLAASVAAVNEFSDAAVKNKDDNENDALNIVPGGAVSTTSTSTAAISGSIPSKLSPFSVKDKSELSTNVNNIIQFSPNKFPVINQFCRLVDRISKISETVGKDGKFQKFVCIGIREHKFPEWIELFGLVDTTQQYYEDFSFFRNPQLREFLIKILSSLSEFSITLEPTLIDGL